MTPESQTDARLDDPLQGFEFPTELSANASAVEFVSHLFAVQLPVIAANEPIARLGIDPDGVHQLRAAARRLRCHIRHLDGMLDPSWSEVARGELRWFGLTLGAVRDLEVMRDVLAACAASLPATDVQFLEPLFAIARADRNRARDTMLAALDSERHQQLRHLLADAATKPPVVVESDLDAHSLARHIAERAWRRLERDVQSLGPSPSDPALHHVRLRAKRARFAAEAAVPVCGQRARKFAKAMANVQTVLGSQHDAVVAHYWVRDHAMHEDPQVAFAAGMVAGLLRNAAQSAAREFPVIWAKAARPKLRAWM